jgi:hypothetical protein
MNSQSKEKNEKKYGPRSHDRIHIRTRNTLKDSSDRLDAALAGEIDVEGGLLKQAVVSLREMYAQPK